MRIALILPGFSSDEHDWCIPALLNFVRAASQRVELEVFALRYPHRRDTYRIGNATVHSLGWAQRRGVHSATLWANAVALITQRHRHRPFDVLHTQWADEPGWIGATAASLLSVPLIISVIGGELSDLSDIGYGLQQHALPRRLIAWTLRNATRVTGGSQYTLDLIRAHGIAQPTWLPWGVDTKFFAPLPPSQQPASIVSGVEGCGLYVNRILRQAQDATFASRPLINVGSLLPVKGQLSLLRVMRRVVDAIPQARLQLVGEGPLKHDLRLVIEQLNLQAHVTLNEAIAHDELPALYQQASLFAQTSLHEGQGMAVLEAMACGVPCVGTSVGVVPELAPTAACAVPVGDERALAEAIIELLRDDQKRAALGQAARQKVEELYSVEKCVERFVVLWSGSR
jgi:glycosyltransferase involved in cell wall biosynthesis